MLFSTVSFSVVIRETSFTTKVGNLSVYQLYPNQSDKNENCSFNPKLYLNIVNNAIYFNFIIKKLYFEIKRSTTETMVCPRQCRSTHPFANHMRERQWLQCWDSNEHIQYLTFSKTWHFQINPEGGDKKQTCFLV